MAKVTRSESMDFPEINFLKVSPEEEMEITHTAVVSEFRKKELAGELQPEPLLVENKHRYVLFPIQYDDVSLCFFRFSSC